MEKLKEEKRMLIYEQLKLLLHAQKCLQKSNSQCKVPHCPTMRGVLAHMAQCDKGRNCPTPHCGSSRQILTHWNNCTKLNCLICAPLRNKNNAASNNQQVRESGRNDLPSNQSGGLVNNSSVLSGPTTGHSPSNMGSCMSMTFPTLSAPMPFQPQQPREVKAWHDQFTSDMRSHMIQKILQSLFPTQDNNIHRDPRLANLANYAIKSECEMFEQARDQEHYFYLLAERIYKIQREHEKSNQ